jgi:ATP-binding cassette subfamily F protein uup
VTKTLDGQEITATSLLERFGFTGDRLTARLGDLSGGERRRFQLLKLLLTEPNVLLLDEPTNDLDIDTLNVLEDFLDSWPGTLIVVSHDRYFLERVTDSVWALLGDGQVSMLPRGVDEYLERRSADVTAPAATSWQAVAPTTTGHDVAEPATAKARPGSAEDRATRKVLARVEKQLERIAVREAELHAEMEANLSDYDLLARVGGQLGELAAEKDELELEWLEASEAVE